MKALRTSFLLIATIWLTGCASTQLPVALDESLWSERDQTIGVAIVELPKPSVQLTGNQGLLDLAVNTGLASGLRAKVQTWDLSSFQTVSQQLVDELSKHGYKAKVLQPIKLSDYSENKTQLGYAKRDFSPIKQQHKVDKLILISLHVAGTTRSYYSVIPTSDPLSQAGGLTQVINLDDSRLLYYQPFAAVRAAEGDWDEGPEYPNLSNAFYQSLDETEQLILAPFRAPLISAQ